VQLVSLLSYLCTYVVTYLFFDQGDHAINREVWAVKVAWHFASPCGFRLWGASFLCSMQ